MTFSPVDNELLLSEMDMMEVYGGTGDEEGTNTYCYNTKCTCSIIIIPGVKYTPGCHFGSGTGSGSGSGKGK